MPDPTFWSRLKSARLVRVLGVYIGAAWVLLQVIEVLQDGLSLPDWLMPVTLILLVVGFVIVIATAWVQSHPLMEAREAADEVPDDWELGLSDVKESLARGELPHPNWARALVGGSSRFQSFSVPRDCTWCSRIADRASSPSLCMRVKTLP